MKGYDCVYPYDKTLQVGDLVRGYYKGIHKILKIEDREDEGAAPLVTTVQMLMEDLRSSRSKTKEYEFDISYCKKMTKEVMLAEIEEKIETLNKAKIVIGNFFKRD